MSQAQTRYSTLPVNWTPETDFKDGVATMDVQMKCVHNGIIRCVNSMFQNACRIKKQDELSFIGYCQMFIDAVHTHHDIEETIIFPCLSSELDMQVNIDQHQTFHRGLDEFQAYLTAVKNKDEVYNGEKLVQILESFSDQLIQHLNDEIPTLHRERLAKVDKEIFEKMMMAIESRLKSEPLTTEHAFLTVHHDVATAPTWPPAPWIVSWIIINIAYWRHSDYWKFAPFNRRRELQEYV